MLYNCRRCALYISKYRLSGSLIYNVPFNYLCTIESSLEPAFISGVGVIAVLDPVLSLAQAIFSCGMTTFLIDKNKISLRNEAEG